jgi:hypothetical protein
MNEIEDINILEKRICEEYNLGELKESIILEGSSL